MKNAGVNVPGKILKVLKFIAPDFLIVIMILSLAGSFNSLWHSFDISSRFLFFLNKGYRNGDVLHCYYGLEHTGQPLLREYEYTDSLGQMRLGYYQMEALGDDLGIYFYLPMMMKYLGMSPLLAYNFFFIAIVISGFLLGITGMKLLYRNRISRIISYIYLTFLTFFCFYILDVYVWVFLLVSFIPLFIWVVKKSIRENKAFYLFVSALILGTVIGLANQFRNHTGTGLLLFIILYIIIISKETLKLKVKILTITLMLISTMFSGIYFNFVLEKRNEWLRKNNQGITLISEEKTHIFWHNIYLGLAYAKNNRFGIVWDDWYAYRKAYSIDTTLDFKNNYRPVITSRYERVIRDLYFQILREDPYFILKTYSFKMLEVLLQLFIFFNVGVILLFKVKPGYKVMIPLLICIGFYSIAGVLVWPFPMYILGALSICIYALLMLIGEYMKRESMQERS